MLNLNLSRKYRSQNFDEIVGQELSVRILKNTLYLNHFFPVYLFAGQRGCGKTSTARIFASAINCEQLADFQKDPKQYSVPCLKCTSCIAMRAGTHPDFIEADAASHTGVDNVRNIIDAASLLPILGKKKIYLIDEAHMLSKAAFNAFLKILEEPPDSVLFILATTDVQKIITTVRSRCFQLLFTPIDETLLVDHLMRVCEQEEIKVDRPSLEYIVLHSEGSARDALNLLEQVRFSSSVINQQVVISVLGHCDKKIITKLIQYCLLGDKKGLLDLWQKSKLNGVNPDSIWSGCIAILEFLLRSSVGIDQASNMYSADYSGPACSLNQLVALLDIFYNYEFVFRKTRNQHVLLQHVFLLCCQQRNGELGVPSSGLTSLRVSEKISKKKVVQAPVNDLWQVCIKTIEQLDDPLYVSVFKQASCVKIEKESGVIVLQFNEQHRFFEDIVIKGEKIWKSCFEKVLGRSVQVDLMFDGIVPLEKVSNAKLINILPKVNESAIKKAARNSQPTWRKTSYVKSSEVKEDVVDVSDSTKWPQAALIMNVFPGTVTKIDES